MDFVSNMNETLIGPGVLYSPIIPMIGYSLSDRLQSPVTFGITTFLAVIVSFLAYQIYRPPVDPKSPAFTSDTIPILGGHPRVDLFRRNTFAAYNSTGLNFDPYLFLQPEKFDPHRFPEGREEFKKEPYGFFGWGLAMHPCAGQRWAKLHQRIILANALALYNWGSCNAAGNPDPYAAQGQRQDAVLDAETKFALPPAYCKMEPRDF
ncbi:hypothetical protein LTR36_010322 [Oleoguttula mirabilis]|uniref:Cytochrome P450 n=1 Tax=Oleoguttula mirabilis TaxID=1507867 RepID=A0AAV9J571_9PEZI|nr:hypothetical protein LTR36_010322 [Oleoguttula mirabilis]